MDGLEPQADAPPALLDTPVFLLLTTSDPAGGGDVVRVEALRPESGGEARRFERLAQPAQRLTLAQARTTGLSNSDLDAAPELDVVLQDLLEFSAGAGAWIVPEGEAARLALRTAARQAGYPRTFGPPIIGLDEVAAVALPEVVRRGVADLVRHYRTAGQGVGALASLPALYKTADLKFQSFESSFRGYLPHWTSEGATYFVTFRLADSLPKPIYEEIIQQTEVENAVQNSGNSAKQISIGKTLSNLVDEHLDQHTGACWLRQAAIAELVKEALHHFHGERYWLNVWCIMPNHVHVVVKPKEGFELSDIIQSWKSYTATRANQILGRKGPFWQREYFDYLVRDEEDFLRVAKYVVGNPANAHLTDWPWCGAPIAPTEVHGESRQDAGGTNNPDAGAPAGKMPALQTAGDEALSADLLAKLWTYVARALTALPLPLLSEMNFLLARTKHPLKALIKQAETAALDGQFATTFESGKLSLTSQFADFSEIIKQLAAPPEIDEADFEPLDDAVTPDEIDAVLGPKGALAESMPGYEDRPEQLALSNSIAQALREGRHLVAEAGTGVGKSLAYLAPAVLFAKKAGRPLIVSTHTKNLQSQLFHKDIPQLKAATGLEFTAALLKGRPNYLCLRKFMYTLQEAGHELDDEERNDLLPIMTWATRTKDGDVAEMSAFSPEQNPALWDRLHTVGEDCLARQCAFYHRCFVYKARGLARNADLVVSNHSLVFADLGQESGSLPAYREIVFDEAHTLEHVATDHLACEITPRRVYRLLTRLFRARQGSGAGKGQLPSLLFQLEQAKSTFPEPLFSSIHQHVLETITAVNAAQSGADIFFEAVRHWFEEVSRQVDDDEADAPFVPRERGRFGPRPGSGAGNFKRNTRGGDEQVRRFARDALREDERELLDEAKEAAVAGLGALRRALSKVEDDFKEIRKRDVPRSRELAKEITAQGLFLAELISDFEFVIRSDEPNYVYWVEKIGRKAMRVVAAPLDLSTLLHGQLYEKKRSVILTSATLSVRDATAEGGSGLAPMANMPPALAKRLKEKEAAVGGDEGAHKPHPKSFEFLKNRLGLNLCGPEDLDEALEGSPFDYEKQCRLLIPTWLPEPGGARERAYRSGMSDLVAQVALAAEGRTMVLYTSYAALKDGAETLRRMLTPEGIEVLAQREDGSREALLAKLKAGGRCVLLGTASFWEGVDVPGEALSVLVIAKLPFQVFTDPLVQGRCELLEAQGRDPFLHYSVPNAILRLRQGFGRLIRSKSDRGVVLLCDKRVLTKRYGAAFLRALPVAPQKGQSAEQMAEDVRAFLLGEDGT